MRPDIRVRPAVEAASLHMRRVIRREIVAQAVAFVHRHPHVVGAGLKHDGNGIAQTAGEGAECAAGIHLLHTGAGRRIVGLNIAGAADGDVQRAVRRKRDVARVVALFAAEALCGDTRSRTGLHSAGLVRELPHRIQIADIERAIVEGEAVRPLKAGGEG